MRRNKTLKRLLSGLEICNYYKCVRTRKNKNKYKANNKNINTKINTKSMKTSIYEKPKIVVKHGDTILAYLIL